jgi:hypothetical protein
MLFDRAQQPGGGSTRNRGLPGGDRQPRAGPAALPCPRDTARRGQRPEPPGQGPRRHRRPHGGHRRPDAGDDDLPGRGRPLRRGRRAQLPGRRAGKSREVPRRRPQYHPRALDLPRQRLSRGGRRGPEPPGRSAAGLGLGPGPGRGGPRLLPGRPWPSPGRSRRRWRRRTRLRASAAVIFWAGTLSAPRRSCARPGQSTPRTTRPQGGDWTPSCASTDCDVACLAEESRRSRPAPGWVSCSGGAEDTDRSG